MSVLSMSPPELRRALVVFATGLATAEYQRRRPRATEDEAWAWNGWTTSPRSTEPRSCKARRKSPNWTPWRRNVSLTFDTA
jgi:hypothetical protein